MPFTRSPITRLTADEIWEIAVLDRDIQDLWRDLGGTLCACHRIAVVGEMVCEKCKATA